MLAKFKWARERQFALRLSAVTVAAWIVYAGVASGSRIPHYYGSLNTSRSDVEQREYLECFQKAGADIVMNPSPIRGSMGLPNGDCPETSVAVGMSDCLDAEKFEAVKTLRPDLEKQCAAARQILVDHFDSEYRHDRQQQHFKIAAAIGRDFLFIPLSIFVFFCLIAHPAAIWLMRGLRNDMKSGK